MAVGLVLWSWTSALSAEVTGDHVEGTTARQAPLAAGYSLAPAFQPRPGTYTYSVIWRSSKVATVSIIADRAGDVVITAIRAETTADFDKVFKIRFQGVAKVLAMPFRPVKTVMRERVQSVRKNTTVDFRADETLEVREEKTKKGRPVKVRILDTMPAGLTLDPLSAACFARRINWRAGLKTTFDVISDRDRFTVTLTCVGQTTLGIAGESRPAWILVPDVVEIKDGEPRAVDGMKSAAVRCFISADSHREILRIEGRPKTGKIRLKLRRFVPAK